MREQALQYAARGWPVFRLTGFKTPLKGSHGHLDATTDPATVEQWWRERPKANIGLRCGAIVVIDLDGPGALAQWKALREAGGGCPQTLTAQTARGLHLFFKPPAGVEIRTRNAQRQAKGGDGIDVKGHGGFVVLAPSVNAKNGFVYQWVVDAPIADMPEWLVSFCLHNSEGTKLTAGDAKGREPSAKLAIPLPDHLVKRKQALEASGSPGIASRALKSFVEQWSGQEEARVRSALAAIPANCSRDDWLQIGMALHSCGWERPDGTDAGYDIWLEWSRTGGDKFASDWDCETRWRSFGKRGGVSLGTLFHLAEKAGWKGGQGPAGGGAGAQAAAMGAQGEAPGAVKEANGHAVALPTAFNLRFDRDKAGNIKATCENTIEAVKGLNLDCRYDTFHERLMVGGQVLQQWAGELSDVTTQKLRNLIRAEFGFDPGVLHCHDAAVRTAIEHPYDPVLDYLNGLAWDRVPRLDTWLSRYMGAEVSSLNRAIGRLALVAAVRRACVPGSKFDQIVVMESAEGHGKSTAIEILAGADNFSDQPILTLDDRGQQEAVQGVWLYEIADLAGMARAEVERVKAFASRRVDRARPAYGRSRIDKPRRCVFFASTNDDTYLKSQTGNRRFWPVRVGQIDLPGLKRDRDMLWAEAVEAEHAAPGITLGESLWGEARSAQEERREVDPWEYTLESITGKLVGEEYRVSARDVLDLHLRLPATSQTSGNVKRVSGVMTRLGWDRVKVWEGGRTIAAYRRKR